MNILITGHRGFIGSNLKKALEANPKYKIHGLDENSFSDRDWKNELKLYLKFLAPEVIFHVGACADTLNQNVEYMMTQNYEPSVILSNWAQANSVPLVYSSSAANYGDKLGKRNLYAWSKYVAEQHILANGQIALRYFNVYGPGEEHKGNMASVAYQMYMRYRNGEPIKLFPKTPLRDFIYIEDVINANIFAWQNYENLKGEKYDVGVGKAEPFEYIMEILDLPFDYHPESMIPKGYQFHTCSDEFKWMFRWKPQFTLEQGLKKYKQYLDEKYFS